MLQILKEHLNTENLMEIWRLKNKRSWDRLSQQTACGLVADRNAGHRVGAQPDMLNSSSVLGDKSLPNTSPLWGNSCTFWYNTYTPFLLLPKFPTIRGLYSKNGKSVDPADKLYFISPLFLQNVVSDSNRVRTQRSCMLQIGRIEWITCNKRYIHVTVHRDKFRIK